VKFVPLDGSRRIQVKVRWSEDKGQRKMVAASIAEFTV
jgi:hypothetical protein